MRKLLSVIVVLAIRSGGAIVLLSVLLGASVATAQLSPWQLDGYLPVSRGDFGVGQSAQGIVVFGGQSGPSTYLGTTGVYQPGGSTLSVAGMPSSRGAMGYATIAGRVYSVAGHRDGESPPDWGRTVDVWSYDPAANLWSTETSLSYSRARVAATGADNYLYAIGGHHEDTGHGFSLSRVDRYDISASTWAQMASLQTPREGAVAAMMDGKIYAIGGFNYEINVRQDVLNSMEIYDPATNTWASGPSMPTARYAAGVATVGDRIYVLGGVVGENLNTDAVEYFDVTEGAWHVDTALPNPTNDLRAMAIGNTIYAMGGGSPSGIYTDQVWAAQVPEPATLSLFALGGLAAIRRRRGRVAKI